MVMKMPPEAARQIAQAQRERDLYRRAKTENDDRFMTERDYWRARAEDAEEKLAEAYRRATCDVCLGAPPSDGGWCACGGTGKLADTLHHVRELLAISKETNDNLYAQHFAMQERVIVNDRERNDALTMALCWEIRYNEQKARADASEEKHSEALDLTERYVQRLHAAEKEMRVWKLNADTNDAVAAASLSRALAAEKQNETLRMLLSKTQEDRDALQSELDTHERCSNEEINRLRDELDRWKPKADSSSLADDLGL